MITPPVAIGAFAAANLAGADPMRTGFTAMTFGWTVFVLPFLFVFSGTLLMSGNPWLIALDSATAVAGVWLISAAMMGYSIRYLKIPSRLYYAATGFLLMLRAESFVEARWCNAAGALMAIMLFFRERRPSHRSAAASGA